MNPIEAVTLTSMADFRLKKKSEEQKNRKQKRWFAQHYIENDVIVMNNLIR